MKTLLLAALLTTAAAAPRPASVPASPVNFGGAWTLDKAQSTGLPPFYATIQSHHLSVTQTGEQLAVGVEIQRGAAEPDRFEMVYPLDGSESSTTTPVRTPNGRVDVPTKLKAVPDDQGRIHITMTREVRMGDHTMTVTGTELWEMRADGALIVHRVDQMPQGGEIRAQMVFVRG